MANTVHAIDMTGQRLKASINPATFTPLRGKILVERDAAVDRIGSILLPNATRAHKGKVLRVGKGVSWVQPGETVHFSARGRPELQNGAIVYNIIAEQDLYGVEE